MKGRRLITGAGLLAFGVYLGRQLEREDRAIAPGVYSPVPDLDPNLLYEECPDCHGEGAFCLTCFDSGG